MITRILIEHLKKKEKIQSKEQTILLEQIMGIEALFGLLFIVIGLNNIFDSYIHRGFIRLYFKFIISY